MKFRALSVGIAVLLVVVGIPLAMLVTAKMLPAQRLKSPNPPTTKSPGLTRTRICPSSWFTAKTHSKAKIS